MILDVKRQGLGVSAIAWQTGLDRKTVRKYLAQGFEMPIYGPRDVGERLAERFRAYLADSLHSFPGLSALRLHREVQRYERFEHSCTDPLSHTEHQFC